MALVIRSDVDWTCGFYVPPASPAELYRRKMEREWDEQHADERRAYYRARREWEEACRQAERDALVGRRLEAIDGDTLIFEGGARFTPGNDYADDELVVPGLVYPGPPPTPPPANPWSRPAPTIDVSDRVAALEPDESPFARLLLREPAP
jgi:hypothetical protein